MKEILKTEWLNILWIVVAGWSSYALWGYWPSLLVTLAFFELWTIQLKLSLIKNMLEIADAQRKFIAETGKPFNLD